MKNGFLTLLTGILSCPLFAYAQKPTPFSITGQVADSVTRKPVGYATITLLKAAGLQPVMNTLTDDKGHFRLTGMSAGQYKIGVSLAGYAPRLLPAFTLDSLHARYEPPPCYLEAATQQLQEVTIAGQKPLLEVKDDKLVYNVENDINKDNLTAAEMLRRVPMVTVDPDGNIQLKGSNNFKVLLNGKSTSMVAKNPKEALRSFPAGVIKSIEVITQPSARYDADGAAGIINIITQKKFSGYNGSLYGNYNSRGFAYAGASLNAKIGKLGIASYLGTNYFRNKGRTEGLRESYAPGNRSTLIQSGNNVFDGAYQYGNLELSYDLDSSSSLSVYGNMDLSHNSNDAPLLNLLYDSLQQLIQTGHYSTYSKYSTNSYDIGLDYQKRFKQPEHELSLSVNRNTSRNSVRSDNNQENEPGPLHHFHNNNDEHDRQTTFQLDYARPLPHGQKLETGAKAILRTIESDYEQLAGDDTRTLEVNPERTNTFNYRQDVLAFYTTYRFQVKKQVNIQLGARLEQTYITAHFISSDTSLRSDYLNFIPTVNVSLPLLKMQTITLSYSRRMQRPWVWNLNPYINDNDPNNILYGNPNLQPEFNHSFGLHYNGQVKGIRMTVSADHTFTNNAIESYATIDPDKGITASTYANIGKRAATGFSFNTSLHPNSHWNVNGNVRAMYTTLRSNNGTGLQNTGWSANSFISSDYDLGKGFRTEVTFLLNSSRPALQGRLPGYITSAFTLRKELFHKKAAIGLNLDQPFQKEIAWKTITRDPSFYHSNTFYYPVRSIRISFNWKFGQLKEAVSRKKGVKNDDVKQGEGSKP